MWDFDIGKTLSLMMKTWPFIVFRVFVFFAITAAYVLATGAGAGIGYGAGHIFGGDGPVTFSLWGGILGFGAVSLIVYWIREYILYIVKAGHIAVMVQLLDGREVPDGQGQISYARTVVTRRFAEANVLFVLDS